MGGWDGEDSRLVAWVSKEGGRAHHHSGAPAGNGKQPVEAQRARFRGPTACLLQGGWQQTHGRQRNRGGGGWVGSE